MFKSLILFASVFNLAHAEVCDVSSPSDRLREITFANGQKIFAVFQTHVNRDMPGILAKLINSKVSDEDYQQTMNYLINRTHFSRPQAEADLDLVTNLIAENPGLDFISAESSNDIVQFNLQQFGFLQRDLRKNLSERQYPITEEIDELEKAMLGTAYHLAINKPEVLAQIKVMGFESADAIREDTEATLAAEDLFKKLNALGRDDFVFRQNLNGQEMKIWELYGDYEPARDEARFLNSIQTEKIPEALREDTVAWITARLREFAALKNREDQVVRNLLNHGKSGILIMGERHMNSLTNKLRAQCMQSRLLL